MFKARFWSACYWVALWPATLANAGDLPADVERVEAARLPKVKAPADTTHDQTPLRVRVLVLEFNPLIRGPLYTPDDPKAGPKALREVAGYHDPLALAGGYMQDLCDAGGGLTQYEIAEWLIVRRFQKKVDGFTYTPETYMACLRAGADGKRQPWHDPDGVDYVHVIEEFNIAPRVASGEIDEVWMMGMPYFGYWESAMAGPGAFYINGGVYDQVRCSRRFVLMGFNVERGVAEMLHDVGHRTEATMSRIYGGWKAEQLTSNWARFAANQKQSGSAAVGTCHYPPNAESDYDYANRRTVESTADTWLHYPNLTGRKRTFNCEEWSEPYQNQSGQADYHRNYQVWWFSHLPRAPGVNKDGRLNNWWEYVFNFNAYDEQGKPLAQAERAKPVKAGQQAHRRPD